jgi:predicted nucleic acid-binding protein
VADELQEAATPAPVRRWIANRPSWLQVVPLKAESPAVPLAELDRGERGAILLAIRLNADLVLMDDREGVEEARRLGLSATGTLGVLGRAAKDGRIDLAPAIVQLRQTNFRVHPALLDRLLEGR